jgi:sugar phosphate isomerase/epimerase
MRVSTPGGPALLCYCANVHPGETLDDVRAALRRFVGPVRRALDVPAMGIGLWLSRRALSELHSAGVDALREVLESEGLFVFTMNGFPYGNFQGEVVKREVYRPDAASDERREYLFGLAKVLATVAPDDVAEATISTLPIGHRDEMVDGRLERAAEQLARLAADLARLGDRVGRPVRICLEPEPGCVIETTEQAVVFFTETLPRAALRMGVPRDVLDAHLGLSFDTCHQAVLFEEPAVSIAALRAAGVRVGKVQLSSALVVPDPAADGARDALRGFDEPRFLHQVRARDDSGHGVGFDELRDAERLPRDREWRVHFHAPIHRTIVGELSTSRGFLEEALALFVDGRAPMPHLEVETYTWTVLPAHERPVDDDGFVRGLAEEMRFVLSRLGATA